tara:strand:+ start:7558 stop:7944 length:387 start_codon:yes stop_codon:yes gene_type:complete
MKKIVLDTNFLLSVYDLKIDIFEEIFNCMDCKYELFVINQTINELEKLINKTGFSKKQRAAKFALNLLKSKIKAKKIVVLKVPGDNVDDILAGLEGYIIATNDKELKKRCKKVITIKQKKYMVIEDVL